MAHNPFEMMISLSLDGMLSEEETRELEQHLAECPDCKDLKERMCRVDMLFCSPVELAPPVALTAQVMGRIETYETRRRWQPWIIGVLVVASLIAALNIAAPLLFFALGLNETIVEWPVVIQLTEWFADVSGAVQAASAAIYDWLLFAVSQPPLLAGMLTALVLVSIYIGMREVWRVQQRAGFAQEA
ncbi:MAG TPA: anti-sigma factor [Aggregatilineales bacterium]|nr:anti-sigma factor [Aggregatilineales bacterium]